MRKDIILLSVIITGCQPKVTAEPPIIEITSTDYADLVSLFKEWRSFEKPPLKIGAPDYTKATFDQRWSTFLNLRTM